MIGYLEGSLKQLDPSLVAKRPIRAIFYAVAEGGDFKKQSGVLEGLKKKTIRFSSEVS